MTPRWTLAALATVAALAFAAGRFTGHAAHGTFALARELDPAQLAVALELDADQAAQVAALHATHAQAVTRACDAHCAARCQLALLLREDVLRTDDARLLVERMCASQKANEMATLEHILSVSAILRPEQRIRFADRIGACLCPDCKPGSPTCCATRLEEEQQQEKE